MSERLLKKAEEVHLELVEALGRVCSELSSPRNEGERWREDHGTADGCSRHCESLRAAINELEGLVERQKSSFEDYAHQLQLEHTQYRADVEHREHSASKLMKDYESENEKLVERNHSLQTEIKTLQTKYTAAESSLREKESSIRRLTDQLGSHRESHQRSDASHESRVREVEAEVEDWKWRTMEEQRERGERERELEQSRDAERTLRNTLAECQHQLQHTVQELQTAQQELHSTEANLAATTEELSATRFQLQPKEEELEALQERIGDRAQQLMALLDRRSGDYSRQVQEEISSQSKAYDELLKTLPSTCTSPSSDSSSQFDMSTCLRDFLNPHLLTSHPSLLHPQTHNDITASYQRYLYTFTDFTQRVRVGEFTVCPKSKVRLHRLQQWRHFFKEIVLRPPPGLKIVECPLCDVISLMKVVTEKLGVAPTSLLVYNVDKSRIGGTTIRLWVLRRALGSTLQYEVDSLLTDLSLGGHHISFVSLTEPHGVPSPMEQWDMAHLRVVGKLEESSVADIRMGRGEEGRGGGGKGERMRADSMDIVDLDPGQPTSQLLVGETETYRGENGRIGHTRPVGVSRRAGFHLKALFGLCCCTAGVHGNHSITQYQHLEEVRNKYNSDVT